MEIKVIASGIGASIPKLDVGFSLFSGVYILRRNTIAAKPYVLGIATGPKLGGNNGSLIVGHVNTSWMKVDPSKHKWLFNMSSLLGKLAEVELSGTLIISGKIDVSIKIYDQNGESKFSVEKVDIESSGGQIADTKIRGTIIDMMGKTRDGGSLCAQP